MCTKLTNQLVRCPGKWKVKNAFGNPDQFKGPILCQGRHNPAGLHFHPCTSVFAIQILNKRSWLFYDFHNLISPRFRRCRANPWSAFVMSWSRSCIQVWTREFSELAQVLQLMLVTLFGNPTPGKMLEDTPQSQPGSIWNQVHEVFANHPNYLHFITKFFIARDFFGA